jgi:hypothetical protein
MRASASRAQSRTTRNLTALRMLQSTELCSRCITKREVVYLT